MLALALVLGHLSYDDVHDPALLRRADVGRLAGTVEVVRDDTLTKDAEERRATWVALTSSDGETRRGPVRIAPGHWELGGMPWDDLREKFAGLVEPRLGRQASDDIVALVRQLDAAGSVAGLAAALAGR
jgi:2-methylcitrate dehydratase PrpD